MNARMLDKIWHKTKCIVNQNNNPGQCYLTVYSNNQSVVDGIINVYLDRSADFDTLINDYRQGNHSLVISKDLSSATRKLIRLKRLGQLADQEGAACHLLANITPAILHRLIERKKDFRRFLREADGLPA